MRVNRGWFFWSGLTSIATLSALVVNWYFTQATCQPHHLPSSSSPLAILSCMLSGNGGTERYVLAQQKEFLKQGTAAVIICAPHSFLAEECEKEQHPYLTCSPSRLRIGGWIMMPGFRYALHFLEKSYPNKLLALHCSHRHEVMVGASSSLNIPLLLTQHTPSTLAAPVRKAADAIITVNHSCEKKLRALNRKDHLEGKSLITLPPFFNPAPHLSFIPSLPREVYFKQNFNLELQPGRPILIKVAHFYDKLLHKNHALLLQALYKLIYEYKKPVTVLLVGAGPQVALYKKKTQELGLSEYVHFLGNVENTAPLFHYADINLLSSSEEAFGIVLLEGGLHKKPTIIAREGCGAADWLIIDKETGFLFQNNNAADLAATIRFVLTHPTQATTCGTNLYQKIINEFLPEHTTIMMLQLYARLLEEKRLQHALPV